MMQAMKGATGVLGSMNRNMNLPALQRIAMEFEKENDIMDQRQEMMDDAIDDVTGLEDEAEGEEVVEQVLEEIGIDLRQAVSDRWLCKRADADGGDRWAKRPAGSRARLWARAEWHKRLEGVVVIPETTISRPDSTACGDERGWAMSFTHGVLSQHETRSFAVCSCTRALPGRRRMHKGRVMRYKYLPAVQEREIKTFDILYFISDVLCFYLSSTVQYQGYQGFRYDKVP
jgi:hypothetical protein